MDIHNITNGLYLIKFEDVNTIKFIKEKTFTSTVYKK